MYIYNVTTIIDASEHHNWLLWMKNSHIPDMLATGKFLKAKFCKVLVDEDLGGLTYSLQFTVKDWETLQNYYVEDAPRLRKDALLKFPDKFVAFRTELEIISEY